MTNNEIFVVLIFRFDKIDLKSFLHHDNKSNKLLNIKLFSIMKMSICVYRNSFVGEYSSSANCRREMKEVLSNDGIIFARTKCQSITTIQLYLKCYILEKDKIFRYTINVRSSSRHQRSFDLCCIRLCKQVLLNIEICLIMSPWIAIIFISMWNLLIVDDNSTEKTEKGTQIYN